MILQDLTTHLARLLQAAAAAGELPPDAARLTAHGTWRPPPSPARKTTPGKESAPGTYATSLPFQLAALTGRSPDVLAETLAAALTAIPEITRTHPVNGYLTITIAPAHFAALPARIVAAGPAAARSDALTGQEFTAPALPDLTGAPTWADAWRSQHQALLGRLADAAGAKVKFSDDERMSFSTSPLWAGDSTPESAIEEHELDAVRYALARSADPSPAAITAQLDRPLDVSNPFVLVRHAHADAVSTLRWAADLGLGRLGPGGAEPPHPEASPVPRRRAMEPQPPELAVIDQLAWLPERVASACRRARPADVTAYLERLAELWLACSESCPALPFRGRGAPSLDADADRDARLLLAGAAGVALQAGLGLLGVAAPARI